MADISKLDTSKQSASWLTQTDSQSKPKKLRELATPINLIQGHNRCQLFPEAITLR